MRRSALAVVVLITLAFTGGPASAMPRYSDWSAPVPLAAVNTTELEFANGISKDGLTFYFQRGNVLVNGEDLWVTHRTDTNAPWGAPRKLSDNVNSVSNDRAAFESPDGHWLYFASDRPGGRGGFDLMVSWRAHTHDDSGWQPAVNLDALGAPVNTPGFDSGPAIFQHEDGATELYLVSNPTGPQAFADVYVSVRRPDGSFGTPAAVTELNSPASEGRPYLRHDGREIFLQSNRAGTQGGSDIYVSTRADTDDPWSQPERVPVLSTTFSEVTPVLSWDGRTLFFASNRDGRVGEIYFSTRAKAQGRP